MTDFLSSSLRLSRTAVREKTVGVGFSASVEAVAMRRAPSRSAAEFPVVKDYRGKLVPGQAWSADLLGARLTGSPAKPRLSAESF